MRPPQPRGLVRPLALTALVAAVVVTGAALLGTDGSYDAAETARLLEEERWRPVVAPLDRHRVGSELLHPRVSRGTRTTDAPQGGWEPGAMPPLATQPAELPAHHLVEPGETLSDVAEHYGLSVAELERSNALRDPRRLRPGQVLVLPDPADERPHTPAQALRAQLPVGDVLAEVAHEHGWDPAKVKAIAWVESRWDQRVVSSKGAIGVMQVQPATGHEMSEQRGEPLDLYDVRDNIVAGVAYLDHLHEHYRGDLRATLAAYHQGPESLRRQGVLPSTERYIVHIARFHEQFQR